MTLSLNQNIRLATHSIIPGAMGFMLAKAHLGHVSEDALR